MQPTKSEPDLLKAFQPLLRACLSAVPTAPEQHVANMISWPDARSILQKAVRPQEVRRPLAETIAWIRSVMRPEFLVAGWEAGLIAVPAGLNEQDAFFAGWSSRGRPIQIALTLTQMHVATRLPGDSDIEDQQATLARAIQMAVDLFILDELPGLEEWRLASVAGVLIGRREVNFAHQWFETLKFYTDGRGVQFSFLRYRNRDIPKRTSNALELPPWFEFMRAADVAGQ